MPKVRIKEPMGSTVIEFRPGRVLEIAGSPFPKSHPWLKAAASGVLAHPVLDAKGYTSELIADPIKPTFVPRRENVSTERDRRIDQHIEITLDDARTFPVDMANGGRRNIAVIAQVAGEKEALGITTPVTFRDANNTDQVLTNNQVRAMAMQIANRVDAIYKASWTLKDIDPIPVDFNDDKHWP